MAITEGITEEVAEVASKIDAGNIDGADAILRSLSPSERLLILSRLTLESRRNLFLGLEAAVAADYLHDIPEDQALSFFQRIAPDDAVEILEELPKDEQVDIMSELPELQRESIFKEVPQETEDELRELLVFEEDQAGGLMIREFVSVSEEQTVAGVIRQLQSQAEEIARFDIQYIYVVRKTSSSHSHSSSLSQGKLCGVLTLRGLLLSDANRPISELMIREPLCVPASMQLLDLHQLMSEHSFLGIPVVDAQGGLLGVLRRDDVEEAVAEQYADDYRKSQGIVNEELRTMPLYLRSYRRLSWLSVNILLNVFAASVIALYQDTLAQVIALAVFLPIISDMSGCSGNQAVAVSMRELSLGLIQPAELFRVWVKEVGVGLVNGLALGLLIAAVALIWKGNPWLGMVVGIALMTNTIIAVSLGGTLPLLMRRLGMDPALASGPILTTVTDMCGFFLVLSLASLWIQYLV